MDSRTPANIGAAARCMMNMGLTRMVLVNPPPDPKEQARTLAAGADRILDEALLFTSLDDAVADQNLVIGTSRHPGRLRKNISTPRAAVPRVIPLLGRNKVAFVFGNEVNGLELDHLKLCNEIVCIPSWDAFPSLNVSHAVMVIAYELFSAAFDPCIEDGRKVAASDLLNRFYDHLQSTLGLIGFLNPVNRDRMMFSFRQIFGRAVLDERDVRILQGVLSNIERIVKE